MATQSPKQSSNPLDTVTQGKALSKEEATRQTDALLKETGGKRRGG